MNLTESCQKSDIVSVKDSSCIIHCTSNNVDYRMKKGSEKPLCRLYLRFEYMNTNISRIFQRENRFSQILFFAILSLSEILNFFFWNKSIKFSNHIYAKPLIYFHNYPFFCFFFQQLNPGEISQIKKLAIIQSRHMYIYIKNICTCANTIYLDICMKSMNGNKLRIALNEILNKTASRYWQHREL